MVSDSSLAGKPASAVVRYLRRHGLVVDVRFRTSDQRPTGTVLAVLPDGRVPVGTRVAVIVAVQPVAAPAPPPGPAHGHGHGKDKGKGHEGKGHDGPGPGD